MDGLQANSNITFLAVPESERGRPRKTLPSVRSFNSNECVFITESSSVVVNFAGEADLPASPKPNVCHELKGVIQKRAKHMNGKVNRQIIYSLGRNVLCMIFLVCLIIILCEMGNFKEVFLEGNGVIALALLILGSCGIPFQIHHAIGEFDGNKRRTTVLRKMIGNPVAAAEFEEMMKQRFHSPPSMTVEIKIRSGALNFSESKHHWSMKTRKIEREFTFSDWTDESDVVSTYLSTSSNPMNWFFVQKAYYLADEKTKSILETEITKFKDETQYTDNSYYMSMEYLLDLKDVDYFPDVEVHLVTSGTDKEVINWFYNPNCYKVFVCCSLDFVYNLIFHYKSNHLRNFILKKVLTRQ